MVVDAAAASNYFKTMEEKDKIEAKVTAAILQQPQDFKIGDKTYRVESPTVATLILASEAISRLPHIDFEEGKIFEDVLNIAKDCRPLGEIAAIVLLGARNLTETVIERQTVRKPHLWGLYHTTEEIEVERTINRKEELTDELLQLYKPRELHTLIAELLQKIQVGDFFGLTTFLIEINLLRQTKVEEN